jgi:hypothetical protein
VPCTQLRHRRQVGGGRSGRQREAAQRAQQLIGQLAGLVGGELRGRGSDDLKQLRGVVAGRGGGLAATAGALRGRRAGAVGLGE